jgi:hypothetical protein
VLETSTSLDPAKRSDEAVTRGIHLPAPETPQLFAHHFIMAIQEGPPPLITQ